MDVLGDVDEHRAQVAEGDEEECFFYDARDVINVKDEIVVLDDGVGDLDDGGFLEGIGADHSAGDLVNDGNHGDRVKEGIGVIFRSLG